MRPTDKVTLSLAHGLVERLAETQDPSKYWSPLLGAILAFREQRHAEALALLDRYREGPQYGASGLGAEKSPGERATVLFFRAMTCAELRRGDEAQRDFAKAHEFLGLALGDKPGHDLGGDWRSTLVAKDRQREAEALFRAKGMPLPEPAAR